MSMKLEQAARQALEALETLDCGDSYKTHNAATALREALGNSLKPKCFADYQPNHAIDRACASCPVAAECQTGEQAEQEPVAWMEDSIEFYASDIPSNTFTIPLYAAPVRTKDLTDDEIMKINVDTASIVPTCDRQFHFARAVIAADRSKNGII